MNSKNAKKLKQMYRREVRKEAKKSLRQFSDMIRPKPRYIPTWLWRKLLELVIKV